jgi:GNAT superfamily N-acetyltransferase
VTFSTWRPSRDQLSAEAQHLVDSTSCVFPLARLRFLTTHVRFMIKHPLRYWGTLLFLLTRPGGSLKSRIRTFCHFCEAVYLAPEVQRRGVNHIHSHFALNSATVAMVIARLLDISFSFTAYHDAAGAYLPNAKTIADHFHVVKGLNEALADVRRTLQRYADETTRAQLKGSRWLLLKNQNRSLRLNSNDWPKSCKSIRSCGCVIN